MSFWESVALLLYQALPYLSLAITKVSQSASHYYVFLISSIHDADGMVLSKMSMSGGAGVASIIVLAIGVGLACGLPGKKLELVVISARLIC